MESLTTRQKQILEFIKREIERCNYPPSVREICRELGFKSSSTAHAHLEALQRKGYIRRDPTKPRAIELLAGADQLPIKRCHYAPLVGRITAGKPILADENLEGYFPLPQEISAGGNGFVLRVEGDSMTGAGIKNGDYVIIRQQSTAENGEIVAVLIDDEATIKRFYRENDVIRLQPENDKYEPIYTREAEILGKVIAIFRKL